MKNEIVEKIKAAVSSTTKKAVRLSGEAIDFTKLKLKIADVNSRLDEKYAQIGLAVYEGNSESDVDAICDEIKALREELEDYEFKLSEYKNQKVCSACGAICEKEDTFCRGCGEKF